MNKILNMIINFNNIILTGLKLKYVDYLFTNKY